MEVQLFSPDLILIQCYFVSIHCIAEHKDCVDEGYTILMETEQINEMFVW
jgi:hypothetical protein